MGWEGEGSKSVGSIFRRMVGSMGWEGEGSKEMSLPTREPDEEMREESQKCLSVEASGAYGRRVR
jgi:hypothetical protein